MGAAGEAAPGALEICVCGLWRAVRRARRPMALSREMGFEEEEEAVGVATEAGAATTAVDVVAAVVASPGLPRVSVPASAEGPLPQTERGRPLPAVMTLLSRERIIMMIVVGATYVHRTGQH